MERTAMMPLGAPAGAVDAGRPSAAATYAAPQGHGSAAGVRDWTKRDNRHDGAIATTRPARHLGRTPT